MTGRSTAWLRETGEQRGGVCGRHFGEPVVVERQNETWREGEASGQALEAGLICPKNGGKHFNQRSHWAEPPNLGLWTEARLWPSLHHDHLPNI